ncbi:MAG: DNA replication/repair protein RecF [Phyllobacteriaceae bacterium]|nr:DNA replication/repair protein RecF [Phyllobacteriaceae bacterium]
MSVTRLKLNDFRNYRGLDLHFGPASVVLAGENGAGKTNLLEALSLLAPGRGLRRAAYGEVARAGSSAGFAVHGWLAGPYGETEIGTAAGGGGEAGEGARRVRIDGTNARSADALLEWVRVIWLTPALDGLFTGPAGDRRRFLDRLVLTIDPDHGRRALDYERAMRGRNRLLAEERADAAWLDAIEREMAESGVAIAAARVEALHLLSALTDMADADSPFPRALLALSGWPEDATPGRPAGDVEEEFRLRLRDGRNRDRAAGRTLDGPHRTDVLVRHGPKDMAAEFCSTGEQKALLIGIVLAHARLVGSVAGFAPILLLDEIGAHLDGQRRSALFDIVEELNVQAFTTGTEDSLFSSLAGRARFFHVANATVSPISAD